MINKDYKLELERIEELLEQGQYTQAHEKIQWLKELKPVPLKLDALEARYHLLMGNNDMVATCLDNKWQPNYDYDGLFDALQVYEDLYDKLGDDCEKKRYRYMKQLVRYMETDTEEWRECQGYKEELESLGQRFYETGDRETLKEMADAAYVMSDAVWYVAIQQYFCVQGMSSSELSSREWIDVLPNMGWVRERLEKRQDCAMVIVAEDRNWNSCQAMARLLAEMKKPVWLIEPPEPWEHEEEDIVMAQESFRLQERDAHGIQRLPSFFLETETGQRLDNRAAIVASLLRHEDVGGLAMVIASGNLSNDLEMEDTLKKCYSRFNMGQGDLFDSNLSAGWAGDYRMYISTIYNHDVTEWMERKPAYRYSIVIPVRNSASTLRYTLQTCLELDYPKDRYEVVVSDNSTDNNEDVYRLCQELDDERIHYYRTPRDLPLTKSFEYAFLQAQGAFLFSIGADDAVLPWALQVLDDVQEQYPNEQVIQWHRGFYMWKGINHPGEDLFLIPRKYQSGDYKTGYVAHSEYMRNLLQDPQSMYTLPMLYITSGCKREYLHRLLRETGRLWDGPSQDIYMGVVNILINNQILNMDYPLTIAGMANVSVGLHSTLPKTDNSQSSQFHDELRSTSNVGGYCRSMTERLMPEFFGSDAANLYCSLLRAAARGILPNAYIGEIFDWKQMFWNCARQLNARNTEFDKWIQCARYEASWHGEEFLKWFDDAIYEPIIQPTRYEEEKIDAMQKIKAYAEGELEGGGITVDASKYGVENVYEAAQLFCKLSGLGSHEETCGQSAIVPGAKLK